MLIELAEAVSVVALCLSVQTDLILSRIAHIQQVQEGQSALWDEEVALLYSDLVVAVQGDLIVSDVHAQNAVHSP